MLNNFHVMLRKVNNLHIGLLSVIKMIGTSLIQKLIKNNIL